jgi:hypothetical protein
MKFSDLAAKFKSVEHSDSATTSQHAVTEIQEKYLSDISGAVISGWGNVGTGQPFNAWAAWNKSF